MNDVGCGSLLLMKR